MTTWLKVGDNQYEKKGVLQLGLQFNFWVTMTICNSLYFYTHNYYRTSCMNCNSLHIRSHSNIIICNFITTILFQLLCNSPITTTMMSYWRHFSSIHQNVTCGTMKFFWWFYLRYFYPSSIMIIHFKWS
jgi:hypothetical protein